MINMRIYTRYSIQELAIVKKKKKKARLRDIKLNIVVSLLEMIKATFSDLSPLGMWVWLFRCGVER